MRFSATGVSDRRTATILALNAKFGQSGSSRWFMPPSGKERQQAKRPRQSGDIAWRAGSAMDGANDRHLRHGGGRIAR